MAGLIYYPSALLSDRMLIQFKDYNSANEVIFQNYQTEWDELLSTLNEMSLHLKASINKENKGVLFLILLGQMPISRSI